MPQRHPLLAALLPALVQVIFCAPPVVSAGFNWGVGCSGGNGTFTLNLTAAGQLATVGKIPAGKWNVRVFLSAAADVDVQIYDEDDKSKFPEGKAVVAWCADAKTCNIGALSVHESGPYTSMYI